MIIAGMEFKDVSTEEWREYVQKDGAIIRIEEPLWLYVKCERNEAGQIISSSHRILDKAGVSHWVGCNEVRYIRWRAKPGCDAFVF